MIHWASSENTTRNYYINYIYTSSTLMSRNYKQYLDFNAIITMYRSLLWNSSFWNVSSCQCYDTKCSHSTNKLQYNIASNTASNSTAIVFSMRMVPNPLSTENTWNVIQLQLLERMHEQMFLPDVNSWSHVTWKFPNGKYICTQ